MNNYTKHVRMCQYGSCRETWSKTESGMGHKKYCIPHSKVMRLAYQRNWDRTKRK